MWRFMARLPVRALVLLILCYKAMLRPFLIGHCKFCPTCSDYALEALNTHGVRRGLGLTVSRICRCHPFSSGGIDPVPTRVRE